MKQKVIGFTGISGVGKTTFLHKLAEVIDFQHLTAGDLIARARGAETGVRDAIRFSNLNENQKLLIEGFSLARDPTSRIVILDGHAVIDSGEELLKVSSEVFRSLGLYSIVHLEDKVGKISENRKVDGSRSRPNHPLDVLAMHQSCSREHARIIAGELSIPFYSVRHFDVLQLANMLVIR